MPYTSPLSRALRRDSSSLPGKVRFFLGREGWGLRGGGGGVISESEHQKGRVIPLCKLFKVRVTHIFQNEDEQVA